MLSKAFSKSMNIDTTCPIVIEFGMRMRILIQKKNQNL